MFIFARAYLFLIIRPSYSFRTYNIPFLLSEEVNARGFRAVKSLSRSKREFLRSREFLKVFGEFRRFDFAGREEDVIDELTKPREEGTRPVRQFPKSKD